jgi:hypothetical protein
MTSPTLPFGTAMALAERNLRGPLVRILAEEELEAGAWFTVNALGLRGAAPRAVLKQLLSTNGYDEANAEALLSRLATDALVENSEGWLRLTPIGRERFDSISGRIRDVTRRIFGLFDPTRVETTRALLQQIAEVDPATIDRVAFE